MTITTNSFKDNFRLYYRPLCLFALHYLHDIDNAEDTVQDCFAELWERKTQCRTVLPNFGNGKTQEWRFLI